ncbi:MAG: nucleotidyltransferase domain-containing protein [Candidatus Sumerlaeota bacterium]|nr:nucleotidyltransferase domain-containing protein [Candidatus Sumerlaeota bacterium]
MNDQERKTLGNFKQRVTAQFPGSQLVLFGSRARGDAEPDSDMDVLVILDHAVSTPDREAVSECAWEACVGQGVMLTPVPVSRQDWQEGLLSSSLLAMAVAEDGVPV